MNTNAVLMYCRAGFEADLSAEFVAKAADLGIYGYPIFTKQSGFVLYNCPQSQDAEQILTSLKLTELVFARQIMVCGAPIEFENLEDRISTILEGLNDAPHFGDVCVEHPDTTDGRALSKLCRKITVPLRQALRKTQQLSSKENLKKPSLHVFFTSGNRAILGYSLPTNRSVNPLGIMRLKFPAEAPSRSTLKLDEAIQVFIPKNEMQQRLASGMQAVDLGACPGGWTYQLVKRGLFVHAVDNGAMDAGLMETGQVSYYAEDGFKFTPGKKQVTWLVCDMIEQPQRVAKLIASWLAKGWCKEAIFNLKLPMKQRFESVQNARLEVHKTLQQNQLPYQWQAKHLYHDREEVTVHIRLLN